MPRIEIISRPRQSGRTTELIEKCSKYKYALIVCPTAKQAEYVFQMACKAGKDIPFPITFRQFVNGSFYTPVVEAFLIDNLDGCLYTCSRGVLIDTVVFESQTEEDELSI